MVKPFSNCFIGEVGKINKAGIYFDAGYNTPLY
jgi:hypothetical protein